MSVRLRLTRKGTNKKAFYRVIATDKRSPRDGQFLEVLGTYDPKYDPPRVNLKMERVEHWLGKGALPTNMVEKLIEIQKGQATT